MSDAEKYEFANRVCVNFFDDTTLTPIEPQEDPNLEIRHGGGEWKSLEFVPKDEKAAHHFLLPSEILHSKKEKKKEAIVAELRLAEGYASGCTRYSASPVSFRLSEEGHAGCCCVPFPLHKETDTCTIKFRAFDASEVDFIENAKTFLDSVDWTVTAVRTSATPSSAKAATATASTTAKFQPFSATVRAVEGVGEVFEVPQHQLYQIEAKAADGYIAEGSTLHYRYICCEKTVEVTHYFRPCGRRPARNVVFVHDKCHGKRWGHGTTVQIAGRNIEIGEDGILKMPDDINGIFPIVSAGNTFNPPLLDLRDGAAPVSTVAATAQPVLASGRSAQGYLLDHANQPFVGRPVVVLLPNGDEIQVVTDQQGRFQAPVGSTVYAREDEWGLATEKVSLT